MRILIFVLAMLSSGAHALLAQSTYHVATTGSNRASGTAARPLRTVQEAVERVRPGDTILVHEGVYSGVVTIKRVNSGRPGRPITLRRAGDGPVTLRANLPRHSCSEAAPGRDRTIQLESGADHWIIQGFTIIGGILVSGTSPGDLTPYLKDRRLPGRGMYDPQAAAGTLEALGIDGADGVRILHNRIRRRGINAQAARNGRVTGNEIFDIDCGTGPGILLGRFSDQWIVRRNHVHDIAASEQHSMSEGIRQSGSSMYNLIEDNFVEDIAGYGRGITTDVNAGWNTIRGNTVRGAYQGFSEQVGGWGNRWIGNIAKSNRRFGFNILGMDAKSSRTTDRSPSHLVVRCNRASGNPKDLFIGAVRESAFSENAFPLVSVGSEARAYWSMEGNTWDGTPVPPPRNPRQKRCG